MSDNDISARLNTYLTGLVPPRHPELVRMEQYAKDHKFPIIGPICGYFCYQMARMIGARHVFELGSGYGYSTAWFARAVVENGGGEVHHVVWDEKLSAMAKKHLDALGYSQVVRYHNAEAVETLRQTAGPFDLIFNDIDKASYPASLPVIKDKLRSGGVLIIDNMIWHGEIFDSANNTPDTQGVREITRLLATDQDWISSIIPLRDGLMVACKR